MRWTSPASGTADAFWFTAGQEVELASGLRQPRPECGPALCWRSVCPAILGMLSWN